MDPLIHQPIRGYKANFPVSMRSNDCKFNVSNIIYIFEAFKLLLCFIVASLLRIISEIYTIHILVASLLADLSAFDTYYVYLGTNLVGDKSVGLPLE